MCFVSFASCIFVCFMENARTEACRNDTARNHHSRINRPGGISAACSFHAENHKRTNSPRKAASQQLSRSPAHDQPGDERPARSRNAQTDLPPFLRDRLLKYQVRTQQCKEQINSRSENGRSRPLYPGSLFQAQVFTHKKHSPPK